MNYDGKINPALKELKPFALQTVKRTKAKLNQNENPFDIPPSIKEKILKKLAKESWNRYPFPYPIELTEKLAQRHGVSPEQIIVCNGSNELIYIIFLALNIPNSKVLIPQPSFYLFDKITKILGGKIISVFLKEDFSFNYHAIVEKITEEKPDVIVICSPNNPGGKSLKFDEIKGVVSISDGIVIVDEAYIDFSGEKSAIELIHNFENLIVIRTFSKAFGLAGLRIGYAVTSQKLSFEIKKVRLNFTVDRLAELTAIEMLKNEKFVQTRVKLVNEMKKRLYRELSKIEGVMVFETDTNFLLFKTEFDSNKIVELLAGEGILVRDMSSYPLMKNVIRVTVGLDTENAIFIKALYKVLKQIKNKKLQAL